MLYRSYRELILLVAHRTNRSSLGVSVIGHYQKDREAVAPKAANTEKDLADDADDGYVSPDFDLPPASESEEERAPPPKRPRASSQSRKKSLADDEELALQLLRRRK